jgi:cell division protein FtsA
VAQEIAVGVDIGTSLIKMVAGYVDSSDTLHVVAFTSGPSEGVKKGSVANLESLVYCVAEQWDKLRSAGEVRPSVCLSSIDGTSIESVNSSGSIAIEKSGPVTESDVRRAIDASGTISLKSSQTILHLIPQVFTVDDCSGIESPLGMTGNRLSVETHIIIGSRSAVGSRISALSGTGLRTVGLVAHGVASAEGVLGGDERDLGVCLVDVGAGTTNIVVYKGSGIIYSSTLAIGGANITNDLALGLGVPFNTAERLKLTLSDLSRLDSAQDERFADVDLSRSLSEVDLSQTGAIVKARLAEICELIAADLRRAGVHRYIPAGLVLTGGTANLVGLSEFASRVTGYRCHCATARRVLRSIDVSAKPEYACAAGLVRMAFREDASEIIRRVDSVDEPGWRRRARKLVRGLLG